MKYYRVSGFQNIYAVESFKKEYTQMFKSNSSAYIGEQEYLLKALTILDSDITVIHDLPKFEKLSNEELYAIRHKSKYNPRVIFAVKKEQKVILLCCFLEKSTSDYKAALQKAKTRLKGLEGELDEND